MSSTIERMAADACLGADPHALATSATSRCLTIPAAMRGKFCVFQAEGSDVWIRFGTASDLAVSATAVSTVNDGALTAVATCAHVHIPAGVTLGFRLDPSWTRMADISADTSGYFRFGVAQGAFGG